MKHVTFILSLLLVNVSMTAAEETTVLPEQNVIDRFWTLLEKSPRRGTAFDRVYAFYTDHGQIEKLLGRCRETIEKSPDSAAGWTLLGLVRQRRGEWDEAIDALKKAAAADPDDYTAPLGLGEILLHRGRIVEAIEALDDALKRIQTRIREPDPPAVASKDLLRILQTLGRACERYGDRERADRAWNLLEEYFSDDPDILIQVAETLDEEGKPEEALERYRRAGGRIKNDDAAKYRVRLAVADLRQQLDDRNGAAEDYRKLLDELSPTSWQSDIVRNRIERQFRQSNDLSGLAEYYRKRLETVPDDFESVRRLATVLRNLSRNDEARTVLETAVERNPSNIPLRLSLAERLAAERRLREAALQYEAADRLEPNNPDTLSLWARAVLDDPDLETETRKQRAAEILKRFVEAAPDDPVRVAATAGMLDAAGLEDQAEAFYQRTVQLQPDDPGRLESLGHFYHRRKRDAEAVAVLRKTVEGDRRSAAALTQLGGTLRSLGYRQEATTVLRDAVAENPDDFDLRMKYVDLLLDTEDFDAVSNELAEAEKRAEPLGEQYRRFLTAQIAFLQRSGRLLEVTEKLRRDAEPTATDIWKLAAFLSALGRQDEATTAIDEALRSAPESVALAETAADMFDKAGRPDRAAELFEHLLKIDPPRRIEHLKRLAELQKEQGYIDQALETARSVMASGSGNPANIRYYADMLVAAGRFEEGIETLRRAVRTDGTDKASLSTLANLLFETGRFEDSFEILWRLFEQAEDLSGKLAAVSVLATCYRQAGRFDEFSERLRRMSESTVSRRDAVFCLAQAHLTVDDTAEAYRLLETLLSSPPVSPEDGRILYTRLSSLAESRGDLPTAIRHQKMLCELSDTAGESERLLNLYRKSGDEKAVTDIVFNRILHIGDLRAQIAAVDDLLAHADYRTAEDIITKLLEKNPDHWEFLYRRLMAEFWLGNLDAADRTARRILELDLSRNEPSLEKRRETASPVNMETAVPTLPNQPTWRFVRKPTTWNFSGPQPNPLQRHWALSNVVQFETIFRDRLQLPTGATGTAPVRPQFVPANTADARFGAETWLFRIALQRDLDAPGENPFARTQNALREFRQSHPADGDSMRLEERLRMEYFAEQARIIAEANRERFKETDYTALFLDEISVERGDDLRCRIETTLAFQGDENWAVHAARRIVYELNLDSTARILNEIDFVQYFRNLSQRTEIRDRFTKEELEAVEKTVAARLIELRNENNRLKAQRTWTEPEAVDFLLRFWERMFSLAMEHRLEAELARQGDLTSFSLYVRVLREHDFFVQADRIEEIRHRIPQLLPPVDGAVLEATIADSAPALLQIVGDRQLPAALFLNGIRPFGSNSIVFVSDNSTLPASEERNVFENVLKAMKWLENKPDAATLDRMFAETEMRYDKIVDAVLEERKRLGSTAFSATEISTHVEAVLDKKIANCFFFRIPDLLPILQMTEPGTNNPRVLRPLAGGALRQNKITVTPEYLDRIDLAERELYRLLDLYFRLMRRLDDGRPETSTKNSTKLPSLQDYNSFFERWQGNRTPSTTTVEFPPMILLMFKMFLEAVDEFTLTGRGATGVDPARLQPDRHVRYKLFLDEKREHGAPIEKLLVGKFQTWVDDLSRTANRTPKSAREYRLELEAEESAARQRNEPLPPDRLLLLAVYNRWDGRPGEAARYLDAVPFTAVADLRLREQLVLRLFKEQPTDESLKKRAETAVDRLLGYQLKENELLSLYETLSLLGENAPARKVRDRLLHVAANVNTQYKLLDMLNREENVGDDPAAVRFALRVLQGPSIRSALVGRATFVPETRDLALRILEKADQLYEYAATVEKQHAATPDSPEVLLSLVDLYLRMDRQDEAAELVGRIEGMVAARKITSQDYENLLRRGGLRRRITDLKQRTEIEDAAFRLKTMADQPKKLLENLPARVLIYERTHLVPDFVAVLKKNRPETLVPALVGIMPHVENWLDNFYSRDAARGLLEYAWDMPGMDEKTKTRLRRQLLESFSYKTGREECFSMFHETVFELLDSKKDDASFLFRPTHADADHVWCLAGTFLDLAEKLGKLYEVSRRFLDRVDDDSCRAETLVLAAAAESRRQNDGNAFDLVQKLQKRNGDEQRTVLEKAGLFLALELAGSSHPEAAAFAAELLEREVDRVRDRQVEQAIRGVLERTKKQ